MQVGSVRNMAGGVKALGAGGVEEIDQIFPRIERISAIGAMIGAMERIVRSSDLNDQGIFSWPLHRTRYEANKRFPRKQIGKPLAHPNVVAIPHARLRAALDMPVNEGLTAELASPSPLLVAPTAKVMTQVRSLRATRREFGLSREWAASCDGAASCSPWPVAVVSAATSLEQKPGFAEHQDDLARLIRRQPFVLRGESHSRLTAHRPRARQEGGRSGRLGPRPGAAGPGEERFANSAERKALGMRIAPVIRRIALYAAPASWASCTIARQIDPTFKQYIERLDRMGTAITNYRFFEPIQAVHDNHLLIRYHLDDGRTEPWRELVLREDRRLIHMLWALHRRMDKRLSDAQTELSAIIGTQDIRRLSGTIPCRALLNVAVLGVEHPRDARATQFAIGRSAVFDASVTPQIIFASNIHELETVRAPQRGAPTPPALKSSAEA